ncbi:unnamed protein product [Penicillium nalgiovense]|nr:unnamed protein product [Penicillium nalgiovense]
MFSTLFSFTQLSIKRPFRVQISNIFISNTSFSSNSLINHQITKMQISQLLLATGLFASSILAAPITSSDWTILDMKRVCNGKNTSCTWTFGIDSGLGTTDCTFIVEASDASHANGGPSTCGAYTVSSGWSGEFDPTNGFTTLSVANEETGQIIWPAYTDEQLADGNVVKPDQSYAPTAFP